MIDLMTSGALAGPMPPVPSERRDEGGPAFAVVLAQAQVRGEPERPPASLPETTPELAQRATLAMPLPQPVSSASGPMVVDHATRFDARGMIAMAAGEAALSTVVPVAAAMVTDAATAATIVPLAPPVEATSLPVGGAVRPASGGTIALPPERVMGVRIPAAPVPRAEPVAGGIASQLAPIDEPDVAPVPATRSRGRVATLAQSAPKVAVVALADGLAVSAAVGALSEGERHRLRDTIAATLSRHGLRLRAVTLLAMPVPTLSTER